MRPPGEQQGLPSRNEVVLCGERLKLQAGYATRGNNPCAISQLLPFQLACLLAQGSRDECMAMLSGQT